MEADSLQPLFVVGAAAGFLVVFPGIWCAVTFISAALGGWRDLAGRFTTSAGPPPKAELVRSVRLGWTQYRSAVRLGWDQDGYLHMSVLGIFKVGHPNLRIPAEVIREERKSGAFGDRVLLDLGGIADLKVRAKEWDRLRRSERVDHMGD